MSANHFSLARERWALALLGGICLALIAGALYRQIVFAEAPCPLCILQRYALLLIAIFAFIGVALPGSRGVSLCEGLLVVSSWAGMAVAGRHIYLMANPSASCGIDVLQPIVDSLPLASVWPLVFQVGGFCTTPYPPVFGLSLARWALLAFLLIATLVPLGIYRNRYRVSSASPGKAS